MALYNFTRFCHTEDWHEIQNHIRMESAIPAIRYNVSIRLDICPFHTLFSSLLFCHIQMVSIGTSLKLYFLVTSQSHYKCMNYTCRILAT